MASQTVARRDWSPDAGCGSAAPSGGQPGDVSHHSPGGLQSGILSQRAGLQPLGRTPLHRKALFRGRRLFLCGIVAFLGGCTLAPKYERPAAPVAPIYPNGLASSGQSAAEIEWQQMFVDTKLRTVIRMALENNRDLRVAALNIEKARAQYRIQRAALIPDINVTASGTEQRQPGGLAFFDSSYSLGVGVSAYELDLFGRVRSLKDAALQSYLSTVETRRATHISLVAEVASAYVTLAADEELLRLADDTLRTRQQAYDIQNKRYAAGTSSLLELRQADGELEDARSTALAATSQVALDRNALELLVGSPLAPDLLPVAGATTAMLGRDDLPAGLPSDLLRNRPDILAAEHDLMGANANIGAARAAFFPSISLTGSVGRASLELKDLFDGGNHTWSFSPQINLPIFTGGRLKADLDVSKANRDIAVAQYEKSIQTAFREVADALAQRAVMDARLEAQRRRSDAAGISNDLVQRRYREKVAGYLEVLDAQRTAYVARQSFIQTDLARQMNLITLYKVLGGGWDPGLSNRPDPNTSAKHTG